MTIPFRLCTEAEFLDVIGTKVLRVFLLAIHSPTTKEFYSLPPPLLGQSGLKLVCNVNIVYGNLKSEISQDYAQKPQRNCTFMNSASGCVASDGGHDVFCVKKRGAAACVEKNVISAVFTS